MSDNERLLEHLIYILIGAAGAAFWFTFIILAARWCSG